MYNKSLTWRINGLVDEIERLQSDLYAIGKTDFQRYPENYYALTNAAALRSERITCDVRSLVAPTGGTASKIGYLMNAATTLGIEIKQNEQQISVFLPMLLSKKGSVNGNRFITDPLYMLLSEYARENQVPWFKKSVICFEHIYNQALGLHRVRDYDNLECKNVLDVIALFLVPDDSGKCCDVINMTRLDDADQTIITVMDAAQFPSWYSENR